MNNIHGRRRHRVAASVSLNACRSLLSRLLARKTCSAAIAGIERTTLGSLLDHTGAFGESEKNAARVFGADRSPARGCRPPVLTVPLCRPV